MDFKSITLDDIEIFKPYLNKASFNTCDYSIGAIFMWRDYFKIDYCIFNNILYFRLVYDNKTYYNIPLGCDFYEGVETLKKQLNKDHLSFCTIPESYLDIFKKYYPNCEYKEYSDLSDYYYLADDLKEFKGKKYQSQRNMINHFLRENNNYSFETINKDNINDIKDFLINDYTIKDEENNSEISEENIVFDVLNNFDKYEMFGIVLKVNNNVIGFSIGDIINDTCFVHIEKANRDYKGAYQMIVKEFANKYCINNVKYINREDDAGDLGLRKSKHSYQPIKLLKKYFIEI